VVWAFAVLYGPLPLDLSLSLRQGMVSLERRSSISRICTRIGMVSVQQIECWLGGAPISPIEASKKAKLKMLMMGR
jgi:hypothetical protein